MILLDDVLNLHDASIEDFGGAKGVRDMGLLESYLFKLLQEKIYIQQQLKKLQQLEKV